MNIKEALDCIQETNPDPTKTYVLAGQDAKICTATMIGPDVEMPFGRGTPADLAIGTVWTRPGRITDFSAARNELLQKCADEGYEWAFMLDTDETLHVPDVSCLRTWLTDDTNMLHVWAVDQSYAKPRIFKLPARGRYVGPTHECWVSDGGKIETIPASVATFSELPKTAEQYKAKAERDQKILWEYTAEHPDDPRWWYYLGDTYAGLGEDALAVDAFDRCWSLDGWDEESAWAAYRIAEIACKGNDYREALQWCCNGMARHSGMAELPWLAGFCCFHLGRYQQAIWWERMAIALNKAKAAEYRINFRHEPALWEGPYDVMAHAYAAMGKDVSASADRVLCDLYMGERLKSQESRAPRT